jgi:phage terminase small subunit
MKKKAKLEKLTHRQRKMIKALAKGASQAEAYRQAGYSPKNADQGAHQVMQQIKKKDAAPYG